MAAVDIRKAGPTDFLKEVLRRGVLVAVVALPLLAVGWHASRHGAFAGLSLGLYVAVAGLLIACERWLPFDREWGSAIEGNRTDFTYVILATVMDKATFVVCVTAVAAIGRSLADSLQIRSWPTDWAFGWQIALALLVADVATYLRHRLSHASDVLWRFHRIHHSMTGLYWIRSAYTHPVEQLLILAAIMLPLALLGAGDQVIAVVAFVFGLSGLLQHANVDARSSVLNWIFATPEVHRMHHAADERCDANFSAFLVAMDLLCGTYKRPIRSEKPMRVGLRDDDVVPADFLSHLTLPFRREPLQT
jgi:ornithine lipid hydroxylase